MRLSPGYSEGPSQVGNGPKDGHGESRRGGGRGKREGSRGRATGKCIHSSHRIKVRIYQHIQACIQIAVIDILVMSRLETGQKVAMHGEGCRGGGEGGKKKL